MKTEEIPYNRTRQNEGDSMRRKSGCLLKGLCVYLIIFVIACAAVIIFLRSERALAKVEAPPKKQEVPYEAPVEDTESMQPKYYYNLLAEDEKAVYSQIVQGIKETKEEIYTNSGDVNRANELFQYIIMDFPEFFWCSGSVNSTLYEKEGEASYTVLRPEYLYSGEEKEARQQAIDKEVETCMGSAPKEASDYEKILYVYEYIVNTVDYKLEAPDNQNIYSALVNRESVCAGYSRAAQYLLERMNVFCTYVTGVTKGQEPHAWNIVKCDGKYYYLDATWGDPVYLQEEGEDTLANSNISYDFMCCDYQQLSKTHSPDDLSILPECVDMEANYYVKNGMFYERYDSNDVLHAMNESIQLQKETVVLKFASEEIYLQGRDEILGDLLRRAGQNLCDWYGLSQVQYYYMDDENLNKITVYWKYE